MAELSDLLEVANQAVNLGRKIVHTRTPATITSKGDRDIATDIDYAVEDAIRSFLQKETPDVAFLGEEGGQDSRSDLTWVLDPVDGTANFARGIPLTGISLGLAKGRYPVAGVVDLPFLNQRYSAADGEGAFCGADRLRVRETESLSDAMISIGDYAVGDDALAKNRKRLSMTSFLAHNVERVRMFGSAAIDLVWVAEGRTDGMVMFSNKPWDTSAGTVIAREAGAEVIDIDGSPHSMDSSATIALAPGIAKATLAALLAAMREAK